MKSLKSILILSLLFYSFIGFSQTEEETSRPTAKGKFIVGGNSSFGFSSVASETEGDSGTVSKSEARSTSFSLRPSAGYFVIDNLAVGGGILFSSNKTKSDTFDNESINTAFIFSPFIRYYFTEGNIKPFLEGSVGVGFSNTKVDDGVGENEFKNSIFNYSFDGGVAFFLGDRVSIDLGVGYATSTVKPKDNNTPPRFDSDSFVFKVGFHIFF